METNFCPSQNKAVYIFSEQCGNPAVIFRSGSNKKNHMELFSLWKLFLKQFLPNLDCQFAFVVEANLSKQEYE